MTHSTETLGIDIYYNHILDLMVRVVEEQREQLGQVAQRMVETIRAGRRILLFGTGHSHLLVEEAYFRAGGLAAVTPVFNSMVMLHENPALSSVLERIPGLARPLLEGYNPQPGEMLFVFSNSGVNQMVVEMAQVGKESGLFVVSISSFAYAHVAPLSAAGVRLDEVADIALDNGGEPGDALVPIPGVDFRTGPSSTVIGALLWNSLVVETVYRLKGNEEIPPVFISLNMPGAAEHNAALLEKWRPADKH